MSRHVDGPGMGVAMSTAVLMALGAVAVVVASAAPLNAQVTPHPREMGLTTPESTRPNPADHRIELSNGLVTYVVQDDAVPLVTITMFIGAGYVDGKEGAAEAFVHGLRQNGPAGMLPGAFRKSLEWMTADYSVLLGPEQIEITFDVPVEDTWEALGLVATMLIGGPALSQDDIAALQSRAAASEGAYDPSLDGAAALHRATVLGGTSYGHQATEADFAALSLNDISDFRSDFVVARNISIGVAGPVSAESVEERLENGFIGVAPGNRNERRATSAPDGPSSRTVHSYAADKLQGWWVIGHALPAVPEEDEAALQVMNYILGGGHFDTRLFRATRDRRGLTNDDSGFLEMNRDGPGTYAFHTYGRPEAVRLLLHLTLEEAERIRSEPVTEEELFVAKGALADGVFAAGYRDGWASARTLAAEWARHGSHDASRSYQQRVRSVTADDVLEAARRYLHPDRMTAVLVGPIDDIEAAPAMENEGSLASYGQVVRGR